MLIKKAYNILFFVYTLLFAIGNTVIAMYFSQWIVRLECIVGVALMVCFLAYLISSDKEIVNKWLKIQSFVILYFIVRFITLVSVGLEYSVIRTIGFEAVYLVAISGVVIDTKFCKNYVFKMFITINFLFNMANVLVFWCYNQLITKHSELAENVLSLIYDRTCISEVYHSYSSMFLNPNFIGMMTGIALLLSMTYISKEHSRKKKVAFIFYIIFSLYCIWISNCSNAHLALIVVLCAYLVVRFIPKVTGKQILALFMIGCCLVTGTLFFFISSHDENAEFTVVEERLNTLSTTRYDIWRDAYFSHKDSMLLGEGNVTLEKQDRYQYMLDNGENLGYDVNSSLQQMPGTHNGYVAMITCTGILGFILFMLALWKKIKDSIILNSGIWYLVVLFILSINLFECMFVLTFNFSCLMLFTILALNKEEE